MTVSPEHCGNDDGLDHEPIEFSVFGTVVRGTKFRPSNSVGPLPAIVVTHGWSMVTGGTLTDYARTFARGGYVVLAIDFRRLGVSDGLPRQEIDPWDQIEDIREAVTFAGSQQDVDSDRIAVWGTSYSGGHAIVVGAVDNRVRCVVAQVPTISGYEAALRRTSDDAAHILESSFAADRQVRFDGLPPRMITTVSAAPDDQVAYPQRDSFEYMSGEGRRCPSWRNEVTLRSIEKARQYEPGTFIERIAPTPLLMVIADQDPLTPTDLQEAAFARAREPKKLVTVAGGHYSVYTEHFTVTAEAALAWFGEHLGD
ncbi:hypothetical protein GOPIP_064_00590 [Gordonia polyisoprenivorans NBRC 16320 = JCM 10675]|uniref:Alpha/beta hydrolase n=1 Tax=Gordonia polyisoprenivorans TaxID=84595 RepID=A0A846WT48_9ACTN|nr:alpha/beta hydrolase [Gordonia polyisoprenivorans]NKY03910.1 alpha/beta hydrolase [Gordonia polyisoprenivorans]GAB24221.1 hypothetical protein GOPIP_064_00590 [Gordonia polyisoprenivorans NBRC 16320 = JCM 10675]